MSLNATSIHILEVLAVAPLWSKPTGEELFHACVPVVDNYSELAFAMTLHNLCDSYYLERTAEPNESGDFHLCRFSITDKGRLTLHERESSN